MEPLSYRDALLEVESTQKEPNSSFFLPTGLLSSPDDIPGQTFERQRRVIEFVDHPGPNYDEHRRVDKYVGHPGQNFDGRRREVHLHHPGPNLEGQRRIEEYVENQYQYVAERASRAQYYIDPNSLPTEPSNYDLMLFQHAPTDHFHPAYRANPNNRTSGGINMPEYTYWTPQHTADRTWTPWQSSDFLSETLAMKRNEGASRPSPQQPPISLRVFPEFPVNFAMNNIRFHIEVGHVPCQLLVTCLMLDAVIISPKGVLFPCYVQNNMSGWRNSFNGYVRVMEEVGYYKLTVRLTLPHWEVRNFEGGNTISETIVISVSKNYLVCSREGFSFQGHFKPVLDSSNYFGQNVPSKVWGLTSNKWRNHIYYADRHSNKIYCVDAEGRAINSFGKSLGLYRPTGLAFDHGLNRLVVTDKNNHRIVALTPDGKFISAFGEQGNSNGEFNFPWDVAVNPRNQNVAVADSRNKRVQLFDRQYNFIGKYSDFEQDPINHNKAFHLDFPRSVCFDAEGQFLYSTDFSTNKLLKLRSDLSSCRKLICFEKGILRRPQGILVDRHENVLVADSRNNCIRLLSDEGKMISTVRDVSHRFLKYPVNLVSLSGEEKLVALDGEARVFIF